MPIENIGKTHFTDAQKQQLDDAVQIILEIVGPNAYNLTPKERSKYGKVGEQKKLLINKVKDFHDSQPSLDSPDVNWQEFEADYATRNYAEQLLLKLKSISDMMLGIKIFHDRDNLVDVLRDYRYASYKNRFGNQTGYANKINELKVFFPKTGKRKKKKE